MASQGPTDYVKREFYTAKDRLANQKVAPNGRKQRSLSIRRTYQDGEVERVHVHENIKSGEQYEHVIGGVTADGQRWGRR